MLNQPSNFNLQIQLKWSKNPYSLNEDVLKKMQRDGNQMLTFIIVLKLMLKLPLEGNIEGKREPDYDNIDSWNIMDWTNLSTTKLFRNT